jgi:hypothetical protein
VHARCRQQAVSVYNHKIILLRPTASGSNFHGIDQNRAGSISVKVLETVQPPAHGVELRRHHPEKTPPSPRSAQSYGDIVANIIRVGSFTAPPVAEVARVRSAAAVSAVLARYVSRPRHCRKYKIQLEYSIQLSDIGHIDFSMGKSEEFSLNPVNQDPKQEPCSNRFEETILVKHADLNCLCLVRRLQGFVARN